MPGLLDKLNVLVRSSLNTFLDDAGNKLSPSGKIPAERLGSDIDGEVAELRKKIDEALTVEDAMQQRLDDITRQVIASDQQADAALQRGAAIFETAQGSLDASVDTQLNEIECGFADLMRRSP